MAELMFKRGTQSKLNGIITGKQGAEGCFYLTTDTNRLYIAQANNTAPVLLNQTVQVVENYEDLPSSPPAADNDFYYIKKLNILAVYDSSQNKWVQINPDTNTNDTIQVDAIKFEKTSTSTVTDKIEYTLTLSQQKKDINGNEVTDNNLTDLTAKLTLNSSDIAKIIPEAAEVGLTSTNLDNGVKIATSGDGSDATKSISLTPGANINSITSSNGNITINAKNNLYEAGVSVDGNNVYLDLIDKTDEDESNVKFAAGKDIVVTGSSANKTITVAHKTYNSASNTAVNNNQNGSADGEPDYNLTANGPLNIISGIEVDNGHITKITTEELVMPRDTHLNSVVHTDNWVATLADNNENSWDIDFSSEATEMRADLVDFITEQMAAANTALTYKGKIDSYDELPDTGVEVGDVYLFAKDESPYKKGDLLIAISDSGASGELESDDLSWEHIPSGDEMIIDTLFKGVATVSGTANVTDTENHGSAKFFIKAEKDANQDENTPQDNQTLQVIAGSGLEIVDNTKTATPNDKIATIRHQNITTSSSTKTQESDPSVITAITDVTVNNGHITKVEKTPYKLATYTLSGDSANNEILLSSSDGNDRGSISISGDTWINAEIFDTNELKITHNSPNSVDPTSVAVSNDAQLVQQGNLEIIDSIEYDANGHIVNCSKTTLIMPSDTTYIYEVKMADGETSVTNPSLMLKDKNDSESLIQLYSDNQNLSITGTKEKVTFNMVWGNF